MRYAGCAKWQRYSRDDILRFAALAEYRLFLLLL